MGELAVRFSHSGPFPSSRDTPRSPICLFERSRPGERESLMTIVDSMSLAVEAGLHYVGEEMPGLRRIRRGTGFSYVDVGGETVNGPLRERIESLVIPPAWEDIWISADPSGHILATGHDKAGRKQYIYHPLWEQVRDEAKFERMGDFGRRVGKLRRRLDSDLTRPGLAKEKVTALAVSVMDLTLFGLATRGTPRRTRPTD